MEWNTELNGIGNGTLHGTEVWNRCMERKSGTDAWNGSLEQMHGTELERKNFVLHVTAAAWSESLEQSWNEKNFVWNSCMERKSGTDAWNRARTEKLCLEQLHGTEVSNRCMDQSLNRNNLS